MSQSRKRQSSGTQSLDCFGFTKVPRIDEPKEQVFDEIEEEDGDLVKDVMPAEDSARLDPGSTQSMLI